MTRAIEHACISGHRICMEMHVHGHIVTQIHTHRRCRELGYPLGGTFKSLKLGSSPPGGLTVRAWSLSCKGDEASLRQCKGVFQPPTSLAHPENLCGTKSADTEVVGLQCETKPGGPATVRLTARGSPASRRGRLEVRVENKWGTVCADDSFGDLSARVACRQLGFANGGTFYTSGGDGKTEEPGPCARLLVAWCVTSVQTHRVHGLATIAFARLHVPGRIWRGRRVRQVGHTLLLVLPRALRYAMLGPPEGRQVSTLLHKARLPPPLPAR